MREKWMKILPKITENLCDLQLIECPYCGEHEIDYLYVGDGKTITLYPDAFANTETLVKTLGHERVHVYQVEIFGKPLSTDILSEFERGASISEQSWWKYFEYKNGG